MNIPFLCLNTGMMGGMDFQQQQRMPFKPTRAAGGAPPEAANSLFVGNVS